MADFSDNTLQRLNALNNWLGDVYGTGTSFNSLLLDAGFNEAEIEQIKQAHVSEYLQAIIELIAGYIGVSFSEERNKRTLQLMVQHYGLSDGKPVALREIGISLGIARERIHQLITMRLDVYRDPERQEKFRYDFAAIGRRLLANQRSRQG